VPKAVYRKKRLVDCWEWFKWFAVLGSVGRRVAVCDVGTWLHGPRQLRRRSRLQPCHRS